MSKLSPSDGSEVRRLIMKAPNMETFVEDFRMQFGVVPREVEGSALPAEASDRAQMAERIISQTELRSE